MTIMSSYLTTTKNLDGILNAIQTAQAPEKFTLKFLESLEYKSSTDRLIIGVLKGLGFIDDTGTPTERYFTFLDQGESRKVLADAIREAYEDLFRINIKANELTENEVKNKLKTLLQGQKSETVLDDMAKTFKALCSLADWKQVPVTKNIPADHTKENKKSDNKNEDLRTIFDEQKSTGLNNLQLCYNIQIILPATRDTAVYDALFKSLKEHLLK